MSETTFAIVDTEPIAMEGLRCLLGSAGGLRVVAAENCIAAGAEAACETRPTVLFLDKAFGMQVVLEATREFAVRERGIRVIVWGSALSEAESLRLLHAGASGVVRKTASLQTLMECVTAVAAGSTWIEDGLNTATEVSVRTGRVPLTSRELQVVELVERGMTNRDIAQHLGIRIGTVKIHLKHIFEKTGVRGRYGLALCGLKERGVLAAASAPAVM